MSSSFLSPHLSSFLHFDGAWFWLHQSIDCWFRTLLVSFNVFLQMAAWPFCFWGLPGVSILWWMVCCYGHEVLIINKGTSTSPSSISFWTFCTVMKGFFHHASGFPQRSTRFVLLGLLGHLHFSMFPIQTSFLECSLTSICDRFFLLFFSYYLYQHLHSHLFILSYWQTTPPQSEWQLSTKSSLRHVWSLFCL